MRFSILFLLTTLAVAAGEDRWKLDEHQPVSKTFPLQPGNPKLLVDNVTGFIHVTGYNGTEVKLSADMRYRAETPEALAEAKRDVKLDMNTQGNFARVYLDGPFRNNNNRGDRYYGYSVEVNFEIQVPLATELILKTVNGQTVVKNTSGEFDVHGVNGAISLEQVSGSGQVNAVNGPLSARFTRNPTHVTSFRTVNGGMDIYFQPPLSADVRFKTLNGQIYTDFDVAPSPTPAGEAESKNGKFIYRSNRVTQGRVGKGGPELSFETINGNIRLHTKSETK